MTQWPIQTVKNHLGKRTIIACVLILLVWGGLYFGVVYFRVPITLYLELSDNPWQPISSETYPVTGVSAIDFVDSYHGWIGGENGLIMATTDGGKSWEKQQSEINSTIKAIDFSNGNIGIAISEKDDILVSQNGGVTWNVLEKLTYEHPSFGVQTALLWDIAICDEKIAWVLGSPSMVFKVDISTLNWTRFSGLPRYLFRLAMVNNTHGWATGGFGTIVRTTDNWQSFEIQDAGVSKNFRGIFFWDIHKGWVVGFDNTILATTDGGNHWQIQYSRTSLFESPFLSDVFFLNEFKGWAVGSFGIHYTENGGKSWTILPHTSGPRRIAFANATHGWATAYRKDKSLITTIGGVPSINENRLNFGVGIVTLSGVSVSTLIIGILIHLRKKRALARWKDTVLTIVCPACGNRSLPHRSNFCIYCGDELPNQAIEK